MKTRIILLISFSFLLFNIGLSEDKSIKEFKKSDEAQVKILASSDLQRLAGDWTREYQTLHPDAKINLEFLHETGVKLSSGEIAFISGREIKDNAGWKMAVGREITVPVVNTSNPFIPVLALNGVSQEKIRQLFLNQSGPVWGTLVGSAENNPVNLYIMNDRSLIDRVKMFLDLDAIGGKVVFSDSYDIFRLAIAKDPYALGFCNLSGILDPANQQIAGNMQIMPVDKNGNGKLDYMENIYADIDAFTRGVWIGKYPKALSEEIYAVAMTQPTGQAQADLLAWVLTGGQKSLASFGFTSLVYSEVGSKLEAFAQGSEDTPGTSNAISVQKLVTFILVILVLIALIIFAITGFRRKEKVPVPEYPADLQPAFDENTIRAPRGLYYDRSHTWAFMEKDGTVKIGIDDFLQHVTGPITRVEMKKPGEKVNKGELFLSLIQKGKQLKLYAPVSGIILECNDALESNAFILNTSPYNEGWVYRLEPMNWLKEISLLSMAGKYTKWLSGEFIRLKDFLAFSLQSHKLPYFQVILQDGGALKNNLLEDYGPEVWEDFQTRFLDTN